MATKMSNINYQVSEKYAFPPSHDATPEGLLAVGGDLNIERLLTAYSQGIFPWYSEGEPILWWSPDPRMVLFPGSIKVSRSLRKTLRYRDLLITMDEAFGRVIDECARSRGSSSGTWITKGMRSAYCDLHALGYAHSVEVWRDGALVGGLYGVALGKIFFGESMFFRESNTSKVALVGLDWKLQKMNFHLIDCQISSIHLLSLGAENIKRDHFLFQLKIGLDSTDSIANWKLKIPAKILA
jgi:leucyl/phenylalanyl-tRNA--protein transferase